MSSAYGVEMLNQFADKVVYPVMLVCLIIVACYLLSIFIRYIYKKVFL